jgi:hypothetical protein
MCAPGPKPGITGGVKSLRRHALNSDSSSFRGGPVERVGGGVMRCQPSGPRRMGLAIGGLDVGRE